MVIKSIKIMLTLPEEKVLKLLKQCQELVERTQTIVWKLTGLIGNVLFITAQAVLSAYLQFRYSQLQQIEALGKA